MAPRRDSETPLRKGVTERITRDTLQTKTGKRTAIKEEDTKTTNGETRKDRGTKVARIKKWTTESNFG